MASAAQLAHRRKVKAFYAKHGRFPRKGELGKARAAPRSRPAADTADAAPKRRRRRPKPKGMLTRFGRWAGKNKGKVAAGLLGLGTAGAVAHPTSRRALADGSKRTIAAIRGRP